MHFYAGPPMHVLSGVDTTAMQPSQYRYWYPGIHADNHIGNKGSAEIDRTVSDHVGIMPGMLSGSVTSA